MKEQLINQIKLLDPSSVVLTKDDYPEISLYAPELHYHFDADGVRCENVRNGEVVSFTCVDWNGLYEWELEFILEELMKESKESKPERLTEPKKLTKPKRLTKPERLTWNYRAVHIKQMQQGKPTLKDSENEWEEEYFAIREIWYERESMKIVSWSGKDKAPIGNDASELEGELELMKLAFEKPTLHLENGKLLELNGII